MSVLDVFCRSCKAVHPHASGNGVLVCTGCGLVLSVDDTLLIAALQVAQMPVQDMRFCPWCRETKSADHDCPAGSVCCTINPPENPACGICGGCQQAQLDDYELRRREAQDGSPSDLEHPA